jgi:hypothetical protein
MIFNIDKNVYRDLQNQLKTLNPITSLHVIEITLFDTSKEVSNKYSPSLISLENFKKLEINRPEI